MRAVAVLAILLAAGPPALAEAPVPAAVELSRLVLPRQNWDQIVSASLDQLDRLMTPEMEKLLQKHGPDVPKDFPDVMRAQMRDLMDAVMPTYQEMLDFQAGLLQKHYTATELEELLAFYRSPLGQKAIRITPEVARDVMGWAQAMMQRNMPEAAEKMRANLEAYAEQHGPAAKDGASSPKKATKK